MQMSKEKVIKYYCVLVGADNILNGEHFVPIPDDVINKIKWEFEEDERSNFTYGLPTLYAFMGKYIEDTFPNDVPNGNISFWIEYFEPIDIDAIMQTSNQPREVDVEINIGEDNCFELSLWNVREEIQYEKDKFDMSCIESPSRDENQCNVQIQIYRFNTLLPHRDKWLHIESITYPNWNLNGHIESIEQKDNVTTYHCCNSLFPFSVTVIWHMMYFYDGRIPIYKE